MKLVFYTISLILICNVFSPNAHAFNIAQNICEYIAADDKKRLRKLLKANHLKLRKLYGDVTCNKLNILSFTASKQSSKIGELMVKKLPKAILKENLPQVEESFPELATSIKNRIN